MSSIGERDLVELLRKAKGVLEKNWQGEYTSPSVKLYPHQWSWDSGFIAAGYSYYNEERARREIRSLLSGQWSNGMIPHIRYNPDFINYFPDAPFWEPLPDEAPSGTATSAIIQPPLITIAAFYYYKNAVDMEDAERFLSEVYPRLFDFHRFLYRERDPLNKSLVAIIHPWESGVDNSPAWERSLGRIWVPNGALPPYSRTDTKVVPPEERPDDGSYERYLYLAELFKKSGYEQRAVVERSPFLVYDVLFNSILCRASECLIQMGMVLKEDVGDIEKRLSHARKSIQEGLWDEEAGMYFSYDLRARSKIKKPTASSFSPLFAGIPDNEQASRIHGYIDRVCQCVLEEPNYAVPSYPRCEEDFVSDRYWMGPVWANMNWIIYKGLKRYGYEDKAGEVRESILDLIGRYGFHEYFDPVKKKGCGIDDFSWTAALAIAMCCD